ncbi:MAG: hypothetical protein IPN89_10905 [Saprospiraceae bacterium]|nr:hypothetical protein [Saprospiraceae bacterium]
MVDVNCELKGLQLTNKATDTGGCIDNGWLKWTVIVDFRADGTDDIEYTSFIAPNNDVSNMRNGNFDAIRDDNENGIPDVYVAPTANGAAIPANSIILPTIAGKMSNHKVAWKVTDGCHNFATCHSSFMVADKKAPTPVCTIEYRIDAGSRRVRTIVANGRIVGYRLHEQSHMITVPMKVTCYHI